MILEFNKVRFKNLLSYGNKFTEYDFICGLDLLSHKNGGGKSAINDAIFYGLFGKPFRKINNPELINYYTQKNLVVEIFFQKDKKKYKIERGMKPNIFIIYEYKNKSWVEIIQPSTMKEYQTLLEVDILKCNETIFRQMVVLGSNMPNSKTFMDLNNYEKGQLFEIVTNTEIFENIKNKVKERKFENKLKLTDIGYQIEVTSNNIDSENLVIKQAEKRNKEFSLLHKSNIKSLKNKIKKIKDSLANSNIEKPISNNHIMGLIKTQTSNIKKANKVLIKLKTSISKLESIKKGAIHCEKCSHINYLEKYDVNKLNKDQNELIKVLEELATLEIGLEKYNLTLDKNKNKNALIEKNNNKIIKSNEELKELNDSLEKLLSIKEVIIDYSNLNSNKDKLIILKLKFKKLEKELENLLYIEDLISTDKLKGEIIKQQLPYLNKFVNNYLEEFSMVGFKFHIDQYFKETILTNNNKTVFNQLSNGQKMRISFSIMFAFLLLIESRNGVSTNILILDEVLDGSVDFEGREELLNILNNNFSRTKNIIIISHNNEIKEKIELFNRLVSIKKNCNFSTLHFDDVG